MVGNAKPGVKKVVGIAALALVAGMVVGLAAIYGMGAGSGNAQASACRTDDALHAAIDERARGEVAAVQALEAPVDVRHLAFADAQGAPVTLADFTGRTLLVNLWATWCVPCREEMPALDALERAEGGETFAVIPVNVDSGGAEKPRTFYTETGLTDLPFYRDETMGVFNALRRDGLALGLPVSLIVDEAGCARASISGPADWASPDAVHLIEAVRRPAV